jgi:hypothetical protein
MDPALKNMCKVPIRIGVSSGSVNIYGEPYTAATPTLVYAYVQLDDREFAGFDGQVKRTTHMVIFPTSTVTPSLQSKVWLDGVDWADAALSRNPKAVEVWRSPESSAVDFWQLFI